MAAGITGIYDTVLICFLCWGRMENCQFFLYLFMGQLLWLITKPLRNIHHLISSSSISMISEVWVQSITIISITCLFAHRIAWTYAKQNQWNMEAEFFVLGRNFLLEIDQFIHFSSYSSCNLWFLFLFCRLVWEGYHLMKDNFQFLGMLS